MMGCSRLLANRRFECSGWHRNFSFSSMIKLTNRREDFFRKHPEGCFSLLVQTLRFPDTHGTEARA